MTAMSHLATLVAAAHLASAGHGGATTRTVSASSLLVQMVVALAVVVALIKLASRFVQGKGGRLPGQARRHGAVSVVGRQSLGKGVQVAVVSAARQTFLLGVTQHQITMLGRLGAAPRPDTAGTAGEDLELPDDLSGLVDGPDHDDGTGELSLLRDARHPEATGEELAGWRSTIEQMRTKTVRRA